MKKADTLRTRQKRFCTRIRVDYNGLIRLETRAREFMGVARIRQKAVNEGKPRSPQLLAVRGRV